MKNIMGIIECIIAGFFGTGLLFLIILLAFFIKGIVPFFNIETTYSSINLFINIMLPIGLSLIFVWLVVKVISLCLWKFIFKYTK